MNPAAAPRKQSRGKRRELEPLEQVSPIGEGPAMAVLNERQKKFVMALFDAPRNCGSHTFAARVAGYGKPTSSAATFHSMGYQLANDPKIQAAIAETSKQYITILGPVAVRGLKKVLDNPAHRDFGRAIGIVIDRVSPQQSTQTIKVEHDTTTAFKATADVLARIADLAARAGIDLSKLPPMIDVTPASKAEPA
jgi:phage terminase small subunit